MKKVMEKVNKIPFSCPACHSPIQREILEQNIILINSKGVINDTYVSEYKNILVCSECGVELDDVVKYDMNTGMYYLYSHGCDFINKEKCVKRLTYNPFGRNL